MTSLGPRLFVAALLVLALTILPLPELLIGLRPPWVLVLLLYLQFFLPDHFNLMLLLVIGLALDVLLSTVLGEHAFALSIVSWIASTKARRFRLFTMGQQMALIGFFCLLYQAVILMIDASLGYYYGFIMPLGSTLITILLWPWVRLLADDTLAIKAAYRR
ncbi:Rod shape-determining protein MreD [Legionella massiliensis]|uniref:Rod shape-determining protein MreD n=1 Tax=Legionella massiliensis TaxID=1034943 RepID=A0A078L0V2_9GAMM|nr:rod shape-determining protein MreD [Legionella massiliensis]CDZ78877.1 Rod shape-determining protein MreD [Legionella massiliensis]CEE14615.1 Rod shape-determining protein MreD [Legionella massiliensis]